MLKISYISDLHLDFWVPFTPSVIKWKERTKKFISNLVQSCDSSKEVLCIAGDISHFNSQSYWAIEEFSSHYRWVLFCAGNHDYYLVSKSQQKKYGYKSKLRVEELLSMTNNLINVIPLVKMNTFTINGVKFGGDIMWYPLETFEQRSFFNSFSNDSRLIKGMDLEYEHTVSQLKYENMVKEQKIDVMISHVPIIPIKSHEKYGNSHCYYTPVNMLPSYVIMGHSHERSIYEKAGSSIFMNCLGYPSDHLGSPEIKNFEIKGV